MSASMCKSQLVQQEHHSPPIGHRHHHRHRHHHAAHHHKQVAHKGASVQSANAPAADGTAPLLHATPSTNRDNVHGPSTPSPSAPPSAPSGRCEAAGGKASLYWDCCKVSGAWSLSGVQLTNPVRSCAKDGVTEVEDMRALDSCQGGSSFACNKHAAFVSPTNPKISYGFGARWAGLDVTTFYGACYATQFKELPGKTLIWQAINTGDDYEPNEIRIQVPGGGCGVYCSCDRQWGSSPDGWGRRDKGVTSKADCDQLPAQLRASCKWRFDWFSPGGKSGDIQPTISSMCQVKCPKVLTEITGSARLDEDGLLDAPQ
ncbi:hypothetical protein V8E36_000266 [Tilletia maclaganii]